MSALKHLNVKLDDSKLEDVVSFVMSTATEGGVFYIFPASPPPQHFFPRIRLSFTQIGIVTNLLSRPAESGQNNATQPPWSRNTFCLVGRGCMLISICGL